MQEGRMVEGIKIRVYPNKSQKELFERYFGYRRRVWNNFLDLWNSMYYDGEKPNFRKVRNRYKSIKKIVEEEPEYEWLKEYSPQVIDTVGEDIQRAWEDFWNPNMPKSKKPKLKEKKKPNNDSFRFYRKSDTTFQIVNDHHIGIAKIAPRKLGGLKFRDIGFLGKLNSRNGVIKTVTISRKADKYFAGISYELDDNKVDYSNNPSTGIDLGLNNFAITSDGQTFNNLQLNKLEKLYTRRDYYNKLMSHKDPSSHRYQTTRIKLQRTYLKIYNIQHDFVQKITTQFIRYYGTIGIEGLNVTEMLGVHGLAKKISRSLFYEFRLEMEYKGAWHGNDVVKAPQDFPSTQLCSECGFRKTKDSYGGKQGLYGDSVHHDHQNYYCYNCGAILDRDINAAINLEKYALGEIKDY